MLLLITGLLIGSAPALRAVDLETAFEVKIARGPAGCSVAFDSRRFDLQASADELLAHAHRRGATRAAIKAARFVPHRCVEEVVSSLRRAGVAAVTILDERR